MNKVIRVQGTHFEQGLQQGTLLTEDIRQNIRVVEDGLARRSYDSRKYEDFVSRNAAFIKDAHRELYEEMEGLAQGANVSLLEIFKLNIPAYFMTEYFRQECSMILVRGAATVDGCTYMIKNRDMSIPISQAVIHRIYPEGLQVLEVSGAGTVTYPAGGMNSHGLGVTTTGVWPKTVTPALDRTDSAHVFFNIRLLLDHCVSADEALSYISDSPRMNGINLIVADKNRAYVAELTKDDMVVEEAGERGILYRTNHYLSKALSLLNTESADYRSTYHRLRRIEELLRVRYGRLRFQDLFRIMSDHQGGADCICRHSHGELKPQTVSTSLFVLEDFEAWTTLGNPCEQLPLVSLRDE
jgi:predicted choloylglycine hydrolase